MKRQAKGGLHAPFLKSVELLDERVSDPGAYPFAIPAIAAAPFRIDFITPVTIFVGPNGSGKSTIVEAIARLCGFGRLGGNKNYAVGQPDDEILSKCLRAGWLPKVTRGFYTRAESFSGFIGQVDGFDAQEDYGGKSLTERSHGEAYLQVFANRVHGKGVFLFDEPEAALSPAHQLDFLKLMKQAEDGGDAQFIVATLLHLTDAGILERPFQQTDHFRVLREFYLDPDSFMAGLFAD